MTKAETRREQAPALQTGRAWEPVPTEDVEQMHLMRWVEFMLPRLPEVGLLIHIPNGGKRGKAEAARFRSMGVRAGVPDLFLPVARGDKHGLWIELKRRKGGTVSGEQKQWLADLSSQGYATAVCKGWNEAASVIERYLQEEVCGGSKPPPYGEGANACYTSSVCLRH